MTYLKRQSKRRPPQTAPIPGAGQVSNSAGGFVWAIDEWARLRRFLILGSEGGSYYAGEWKLTRENWRQALEFAASQADGRAHGGCDRRDQPRGPCPEERPGALRYARDGGG